MGRTPIGAAAMTPAQRMARTRARRKHDIEAAVRAAETIIRAPVSDDVKRAAAEIVGLLSRKRGKHGKSSAREKG